jgi:hypothetical protein
MRASMWHNSNHASPVHASGTRGPYATEGYNAKVRFLPGHPLVQETSLRDYVAMSHEAPRSEPPSRSDFATEAHWKSPA